MLRAKYFSVLFNQAPTYDEIVLGTPDCRKITEINKIFVPNDFDSRLMAEDKGLIPNFQGPFSLLHNRSILLYSSGRKNVGGK